eukprot:354898-Chlamydomonas_euryale.AAC.7
MGRWGMRMEVWSGDLRHWGWRFGWGLTALGMEVWGGNAGRTERGEGEGRTLDRGSSGSVMWRFACWAEDERLLRFCEVGSGMHGEQACAAEQLCEPVVRQACSMRGGCVHGVRACMVHAACVSAWCAWVHGARGCMARVGAWRACERMTGVRAHASWQRLTAGIQPVRQPWPQVAQEF